MSRKYSARFVATAFFALALVMSAKYIPPNSTVSAQQETEPKFRPAGPNAKNPRPDEWVVSFKNHLSTEEVDREIDRILSQYNVKLRRQDSAYDGKPSRFPLLYAICIKASAEQARQIAEDEAVESVTQNQDARVLIPPTGLAALQNAMPSYNLESPPESIEEYRKLSPRANMPPQPQRKRPHPRQKRPKGDQQDL